MNTKLTVGYMFEINAYVASVRVEGGTRFYLSADNGFDLAEIVRRQTGVEIEFNPKTCNFIIPEENSLD